MVCLLTGQNAVRSAILCFPALGGCFLLCFTADVATGSWRRDFSKLTFLVPEITGNACDGTHAHSWSILVILYMCFSSCVSRDTGLCVCSLSSVDISVMFALVAQVQDCSRAAHDLHLTKGQSTKK